jgi:hypothetical protein
VIPNNHYKGAGVHVKSFDTFCPWILSPRDCDAIYERMSWQLTNA